MAITKSQRETLRMMFGGKCAYCGCDLPSKGWHADHVKAVDRRDGRWIPSETTKYHVYEKVKHLQHPENDTAENLFPSCRACNIDKQNLPIDEWRVVMENRVSVCRRNYSAFRHAERFGLVEEIKKPIIFHFETYSISSPSASETISSDEPDAARKEKNV